MKSPITVQTVVNAPIAKVWECWNRPQHITGWAFASDDWEAPAAENDLRVGGKFKTVMAAKDGSSKFDFEGIYTVVNLHQLIEYDMSDGPPSLNDSGRASRHVKVEFKETPNGVEIIETFDPENENPEDVQRSGWQTILDNFKKYAEQSRR